MSQTSVNHYRLNYSRYQHYYRQIWKFYQKPSSQVSLALLLTIFTTIFFAIFAIRPTLVTIAELIKTIDDRQEVLKDLEKKSTALAAAQRETTANQVALDNLAAAFPESIEISTLLDQIEATAAFHQVVITSLVVKEFSMPPENTNPNTPISIPIIMQVEGTFSNLEPFMLDLNHIPRFNAYQKVGLDSEVDQESETQNQDDILNTINLEAYYLPIK